MSEFVIYKIDIYEKANAKFIKNMGINVEDIDEMKKYLKTNNGYHFRIKNKTQYIFFGDIDNYSKSIEYYVKKLQIFMKDGYGLDFTDDEFKYTQNNEKNNSYHFSIPKWNLSTEKIKEIIFNFAKEYKDELKQEGIEKSCVDTTIYSNHWFRCPNQKKCDKQGDTSKHVIIKGNLEDFVINYISKDSININSVEYMRIIKKKKNEIVKNKNEMEVKKEIVENNNEIIEIPEKKVNKELIFSFTLTQPNVYKKMFDECYKQCRFDEYESWMSVGMALKNSNLDDKTALDLFNYFSAKGDKYDGFVETEKKFKTFIKKKTQNKYTIATIYYYAIEDNKPRFIEIMNKNTFDLEQFDMCKYVKMLAGKIFIYLGKKIYCFNGKFWKQDDILFKYFLSNDLYEFLKMILIELYFDHRDFNIMKSQIKRLKNANFKREIVDTYKEVGTIDDVILDFKWNLFGFNNVVYDLEEECFREYKYDDYVSITVGYDWVEPDDEDIQVIKKILRQIMPFEEEYDLYLQILSSCLNGKCLEKFIIFSGNGGNGKGLVDDLMLIALGNYAMVGNNSILFETNKTGSNPEKANIHKKRLVIFREPPESKKFENSIIKELTGGGTFSARGHHENETKKELNSTMIVECNKKPIFSEEPTNADIRRIIDINFRTTYTTDETLLDDKNHIYKANPYYKTPDFQQKYKYALIKILLEEHKKFKKNNFIIQLPKSIDEKTRNYLDLSFIIVKWFKDSYIHTEEKNDYVKIKDLYNDFTQSLFFNNLTKQEKQKYNKSYFSNFIETNPFFRKYYIDRLENVRSIICGWKKIDE